MKNSLIHLLLNFVIIGLLTSSCKAYRTKETFEKDLPTIHARPVVRSLKVDGKVRVELWGGNKIKGKITAIGENSFILWQPTSRMKAHIIEDLSGMKNAVDSSGLKVNERVIVKLKNGEIVRGKFMGLKKEILWVSAYSNSSQGFNDHRIHYFEISDMRFREGIMHTIEFKSLAKIKYDYNTKAIVVAVLIGGAEFLLFAIACNCFRFTRIGG